MITNTVKESISTQCCPTSLGLSRCTNGFFSRITPTAETSLRQDDALGARDVGVRSALELAEPFQLAEQVVQRRLADPQPGGQLKRPRGLRVTRCQLQLSAA